MRNGFFGLGFALLALVTAPAALADDWVAAKLRGTVLQLIDGQWVELRRGDVVPDDRVVRTLRGGRVTFLRDAEVIDLGSNTQVQIFDRAGKGSFTTVKQYFGTVMVEANVRNVEHFAVQTPQLAAVVKGTRFTVTSDKRGAKVSVQRGAVAVEDRDSHQSTLVAAGQSASTSNGTALKVAGSGALPVIYDEAGAALTALVGKAAEKEAKAAEKEAKAEEKAAEKESKAAEKAAEKESKAAEKESGSSGNSGSGNSGNGNSGSGNSGNGNGNGNSGSDSSEHGNSGKSKKDKD